MKILHIINSLNTGGAEKLVYQIFNKINESESNECYLLSLMPLPVDTILYNNKISTLNLKYIYGLNAIRQLYLYLKKNRFDVIHSHLFPTQYYISIIYKFFLKKKNVLLVTTEHSTHNKRRNSFFRPLEKYIYNQYDEIILISDIAKTKFKKHLGTFRNMSVVSNGIDLNSIYEAIGYNKRELGFNENDYLIIMVAGFRPAKDQDTLIKAMHYLKYNFKLVLVGDGERRKILEQLVDSLGLQERVVFLGIRNDIPKLLKSANVIVMSSHYEGLSLSSIEGMAAGKPFIASNVDGLKQVVQNYGILFEAGDYLSLSKIINDLYLDNVYSLSVVERCIFNSRKYSIDTVIDKYLNIYINGLFFIK